MQEARVVRVLHVLEVELPVALQHLGIAAEDLYRFLHHAANPRRDLGTDVPLDRRSLAGERREHESAENLDAEFPRCLALRLGPGGHAALALHAAAKRHRGEVAAEAGGPDVIG